LGRDRQFNVESIKQSCNKVLASNISVERSISRHSRTDPTIDRSDRKTIHFIQILPYLDLSKKIKTDRWIKIGKIIKKKIMNIIINIKVSLDFCWNLWKKLNKSKISEYFTIWGNERPLCLR
jgi:hypothetical protein